MFTHFESGDERERRAKTEERLDLLRRAYEARYFKEKGSKSVAMYGSHKLADQAIANGEIDGDTLILVFDGAGPDDAGPTAHGFNVWKQQAAYRNGGAQTGRVYHAGSEDCPTCGRPRVMFVDGDCPGCNPSSDTIMDDINDYIDRDDDQAACDGPVDMTPEANCAVCRGRGVLFNSNRCSWCDGSGKEPRK